MMDMSLFFDDITWCMEKDCPMRTCRRNCVNMIDRTGLHSFAIFKGTADCPISVSLDECMVGCVHAKKCFEKYDDPDQALMELFDNYCDNCAFSSEEED